jgi:hypothetical protein
MCEDPLLSGVCLVRRWIQIVDRAHPQIAPHLVRLVRKQMGCGSRVRVVSVRIDQCRCPGMEIECKRQTKCMDDVFAAQTAGVKSAMR